MAVAASAPAGERRSLDPQVWKACAGGSVRIPAVGSMVYYFPQGHAEQAAGDVDLSSVPRDRPCPLCTVAGVQFLASQETDEVYTMVRLDPRVSNPAPDRSSPEGPGSEGSGAPSFTKVLTPSDANNGGGFSVPRSCADSIFPPLNFNKKPPVQVLSVRDVHGALWKFRHIYRGTPRRHLLTTGWSKFVNGKKLIAGDSVVFIKTGSGELCAGVRRAGRSGGPSDLSRSSSSRVGRSAASSSAKARGNPGGKKKTFSRNCKKKVMPETVVEAARLAGMGLPFEVMYYPGMGFPDFLVSKDAVEAALHVQWSSGTRVKMAVETDDPSRMTWFQGTVSSIIQHPAPFTSSPWRTLEVTWDEPDVLQNVKRLSPWQVELVSASPQILSPYPPIKKPRIMQNEELLTDGAEHSMLFPAPLFSDMMVRDMNSSAFSQNIFPVGIQGVRHDLISVSGLLDFLPNGGPQIFSPKLNCNKTAPNANQVPTELDSGNASQSEIPSPPSQSNIHHHGTELFCDSAGKAPSKVISVSFQLFGKTIKMEPPLTADVKKGFKGNKVAAKSSNVSLSKPLEKLHDNHGEPQRVLSPKK